MDEQLRPCPFCGGQPEKTAWKWKSERSTEIGCTNDNCPAAELYVFADGDDHERRAIAAWNTRPVEDALRDENELLRTTSRCAWCGAVIAGESAEDRGRLALEHLLICADHPLRQLEKRIAELTAEVERLRAALRFYADEDNWHAAFISEREQESGPAWDEGFLARAALAGEEP